MGKSIKQIYAALELGENDLKLIVAEYFNTRFNVLKVERTTTSAIVDFRVVDKDRLIRDINALVTSAYNKLGANIEKVILVLPAYNFKRLAIKAKVVPEQGYVTNNDIARALSNSLKAKVDFDAMVVDARAIKYTINGISTRRMPINEACNEVVVDIDLLCADKDMTLDYVYCVEASGLNVLDITLNMYAIAQEAALFEESLKQNIIVLNIGKYCTYLSLLSKGRLISNEIVFDGLMSIANQVKYKFNNNMSDSDVYKLIKYSVNFDGKYLDDAVYAYNFDSKTYSISQRELNDVCEPIMDNIVDKLITMCKPILEQSALIFVTGDGQQVWPLVDKIKVASACEIKSYYPDTIGVRDPGLTALYGSLFVYRDKALLNDIPVNCIDLLQYESNIDQKEFDSEGETITTKIKNLFKQYVEREEK